MLVRFLFVIVVFAAAGMFSGCCCGPCGSVCVNDCAQCDGYDDCGDCGVAGYPMGPIDALRQFRRKVVCGDGCGEVYRGEWVSTPPDSCDPCQGSQWVGGATPCRPFCWQPGTIFGNIYGSRMCEYCGNAFTNCECGGGQVVVDAAYEAPCTTCSSANVGGNRIVRQSQGRPAYPDSQMGQNDYRTAARPAPNQVQRYAR